MPRNLPKDRIYCLRWWADGTWSVGRPTARGSVGWEEHIALLIKHGLLEHENGLCRITPAGVTVLELAP